MRLMSNVRVWIVGGIAVAGGCAAAPRTDSAGALTRALRISPASSMTATTQQATKVLPPPLVVLTGHRVGTYFEGRVMVGENAHVVVVGVDLDRRLRVLFPASPLASGFIPAKSPLQLPAFYPRMGSPTTAVNVGLPADQSSLDHRSLTAEFGRTGSIVAIASRAPLDFSAFTTKDGDWNLQALRRAVLEGSVSDAVAVLGGAVTAPGQAFGDDHWVRVFQD